MKTILLSIFMASGMWAWHLTCSVRHRPAWSVDDPSQLV